MQTAKSGIALEFGENNLRPIMNDITAIIREIKNNTAKDDETNQLPDGFITNDGGNVVCVEIPKNIDTFVFRQETKHDFVLHKYSELSDVRNYLIDVVNDNLRLQEVCGMITSGCIEYCFYCDYCGTPMLDDDNRLSSHIYRCEVCRIYMCQLCYLETDETTAKSNGAKNWEKRKEKLENCQKNHEIRSNEFTHSSSCEFCGVNIAFDREKWSNALFKIRRHQQHVGVTMCELCDAGWNTEDLCIKCVKENKFNEKHGMNAENYLTKHNLELIPNIITPMELTVFGSFMDWIPILIDIQEDAKVYLNMNRDSQMNGRVALSCFDDHGRCSYDILGKTWTIESTIQKIHSLENTFLMKKRAEEHRRNQVKNGESFEKEESEDCDEINQDDSGMCVGGGWAEHYSRPILYLMRLENMKVYVG